MHRRKKERVTAHSVRRTPKTQTAYGQAHNSKQHKVLLFSINTKPQLRAFFMPARQRFTRPLKNNSKKFLRLLSNGLITVGMNQLTPELINYAKNITAERGIAQADMTPAIMGDILKEAVRRMDVAVTRIMGNKDMMTGFNAHVYYGASIK